ncbi:hypothetical protein L6452_26003 [Arctium lappa]|uniref:Uncharacterized protein n=1 Tax=Arctium lappa TaxID=4217 RepID=A0ACB9ABH8_ARCLA|nr:hypothetical protein L6452_26003 [Arctium lappa]
MTQFAPQRYPDSLSVSVRPKLLSLSHVTSAARILHNLPPSPLHLRPPRLALLLTWVCSLDHAKFTSRHTLVTTTSVCASNTSRKVNLRIQRVTQSQFASSVCNAKSIKFVFKMSLQAQIYKNDLMMSLGSDTRPPVLINENEFEEWQDRFINFIERQPNGEIMIKSLTQGPMETPMQVVLATTTTAATTVEKALREYDVHELIRHQVDRQANSNMILALPNSIYNRIDCFKQNPMLMWTQQEKIMLGTSMSTQLRQTRYMNNFEEFKAKDGESLKSVFDRFWVELYEILMTDETMVMEKKAKLDKKNKPKAVDLIALLASQLDEKKLELAEKRENGTILMVEEEYWLDHSDNEAENEETAAMCFIGDDKSDDEDEDTSTDEFEENASPVSYDTKRYIPSLVLEGKIVDLEDKLEEQSLQTDLENDLFLFIMKTSFEDKISSEFSINSKENTQVSKNSVHLRHPLVTQTDTLRQTLVAQSSVCATKGSRKPPPDLCFSEISHSKASSSMSNAQSDFLNKVSTSTSIVDDSLMLNDQYYKTKTKRKRRRSKKSRKHDIVLSENSNSSDSSVSDRTVKRSQKQIWRIKQKSIES